jgi:pyruvate/2-oxoglutarate dehydrogenase complex dihydrolipoamide acyltransferase (E2) component
VSRLAGLLAVVTMLVLAGCSGAGAEAPPATPTASATSASAAPPSEVAPTATDSSSPTSTSTVLVPGANCLTGTWRLVRFIGLGEQSTYGTGQGGDVTVAFDDGRYDLVGKGRRPITVNLAGAAAQLTIDGTAEGTYQPDGAEMTFTVGKSTGEGTLQSGSERRTLPMASIAQVIAPRGKATLACPENTLLVALPTVRLEFER